MAAKRLTPAQIKDRKAKRLAIGLGVVFLGVIGYQAPTIMKLMNGKSNSASSQVAAGVTGPISQATSVAAASASSSAATASAASATASGTPGATTVGAVGAVIVAPPAPSQLHSFVGFALKDPFRAAPGSTPPATGAPASTAAATTSAATTTTAKQTSTTTKTQTTPAAPPAATTTPAPPVQFTTTTPVAPPPPPNAAVIMTNGKRETVPVGGSFPSVSPLFKLIGLRAKKGAIKVTVLGGSFTNGIPALMLHRGKTLTLANQSDGTRYVVKLVKLTNAAPLPPKAPAAPKLGGTTTG